MERKKTERNFIHNQRAYEIYENYIYFCGWWHGPNYENIMK